MPGNWKANKGSALDSTCCPGPCSARAAGEAGPVRGRNHVNRRVSSPTQGPAAPTHRAWAQTGRGPPHGTAAVRKRRPPDPALAGRALPRARGRARAGLGASGRAGSGGGKEISQRKMPLSYGRRPRAPSAPRVTQSSLTSRASGPAPLPVLTAACQKMPGKVQPHKEEAALFQVVVRGHSTTGRA